MVQLKLDAGEEEISVDLKGKWIGCILNTPVLIQMEDFRAVACFDTIEQLEAALGRVGVPLQEVEPAQITEEEGFVEEIREKLPGIELVYDLEFNSEDELGYTYHLLDIRSSDH